MPFVDNAVHLGIIRTTSLKGNTTTNVEENIREVHMVYLAVDFMVIMV